MIQCFKWQNKTKGLSTVFTNVSSIYAESTLNHVRDKTNVELCDELYYKLLQDHSILTYLDISTGCIL